MNDLDSMIDAVSKLTCQKCKEVISKKIIKETNKQQAREEKEMKKKEKAQKHTRDIPQPPPAPVQKPAPSPQNSAPLPPLKADAPEIIHNSAPVRQAENVHRFKPSYASDIYQPQQPVNTVNPPVNDFNKPSGISDINTVPEIKPVSAPKSENDDIMKQFAVPPTPKPPVSEPVKKPVIADIGGDDFLKQFAVPQNNKPAAPKPPVEKKPEVPEIKSPVSMELDGDDFLKQFAVPQNSKPAAP
ncbi:MAG TPA: hypothetical protein DIW26_02975, partial [Ruminococcus sp.]|nr:hypothetical protein [Ruminococcus sp.]